MHQTRVERQDWTVVALFVKLVKTGFDPKVVEGLQLL